MFNLNKAQLSQKLHRSNALLFENSKKATICAKCLLIHAALVLGSQMTDRSIFIQSTKTIGRLAVFVRREYNQTLNETLR